jgi:molybdopterin molybdotransferase
MPATRPPPPVSVTLNVDEARQAILRRLTPITGREQVAVHNALDRVLAADVIAPCNVPANDNSAMDGYAVRGADLTTAGTTTLNIAGTAYAGQPWHGTLNAGEAIRIMTGAAIPAGADTVVVQEATTSDGACVTITAGQQPGQNIRRAGEDLAQGASALHAGKRCGPAELGLIASLGIAEVTVYRRLRVAFFSTGDELASIGQPLTAGQVYDSNRYTLKGALTRLGCELLDMGVVRDRPDELEAALRCASENADVIVTSGGVSVGDADFIHELVNRLGEVAFWKLDIKPGRPMAFGRIGDAWLFGLPGNPVAVLVAYYQFVQDALRTLAGVAPLPAPLTYRVTCTEAISRKPGRREFVRGRLEMTADGMRVRVAGAQGAGILRSMSEANCFIILPESCTGICAGDTVAVQPFDGLV